MRRSASRLIRPIGLIESALFLAVAATIAGYAGALAWWLELPAHFRPQLALSLGAGALLLFWLRRPRFAVLCLGMAALNAAPILLHGSTASGTPDHAGTPRQLLVANVHTANERKELLLALIERQDPDLILLEEVDARWVSALAPVIARYPVGHIEPRSDNFGILLLSRLPCRAVETKSWGSAGVPSIRAVVEIEPGREVILVGTHPLPPGGAEYSRFRNDQLRMVAEAVRAEAGPVLLAGDLNTTPWAPSFRSFVASSGLRTPAAHRWPAPTWPVSPWLLRIPIDHVLCKGGVAVTKVERGPDIGSDHFPLLVTCAIKAP